MTALDVVAVVVLVLVVDVFNCVTPYALVVAAGILAVPLVATEVPFACIAVIVPILSVFVAARSYADFIAAGVAAVPPLVLDVELVESDNFKWP